MGFTYDHGRLWYSHLHPEIKDVDEKWFYDEEFAFRKTAEDHFDHIRNEIVQALTSQRAEYDSMINNTLASAPGKWQSFTFKFWDLVVSQKNMELCPYTLGILESIPGMVSASVSILDAHTQIKPHRGDTNAIYRCHLPLVVPAGLPHTGLYVGYEERPWNEGKLLVFNDAAYHKAWNNTPLARTVLIFDVLREPFLTQRAEICRTVLEKFRQ